MKHPHMNFETCEYKSSDVSMTKLHLPVLFRSSALNRLEGLWSPPCYINSYEEITCRWDSFRSQIGIDLEGLIKKMEQTNKVILVLIYSCQLW